MDWIADRRKFLKRNWKYLKLALGNKKKIISIRESYRNEDMDKALESAKWLTENHPESHESFVWLGLVQSDRYELKEAIKTLKRAIELNPDYADAYNNLGIANEFLKNSEKSWENASQLRAASKMCFRPFGLSVSPWAADFVDFWFTVRF